MKFRRTLQSIEAFTSKQELDDAVKDFEDVHVSERL
jgi:hypothetical protein